VTSDGSRYDQADWAADMAEHLPPADLRQLARAAADGVAAVRALRAATAAPVLRNACDQLLAQLASADPSFLAGSLAGAASTVERAHRHQSVDVVWTGPESEVTTGRLTAATVIDLISEARQEILLVSFAIQRERLIKTALAEASARGVLITLVSETHADNRSYGAESTPFPTLDAIRLHWPKALRPRGAALHAKIIVVDDRIALVGSANLTTPAMEANLECGILIRGGPHPRAIRDHITSLTMAGSLRRQLGSPYGRNATFGLSQLLRYPTEARHRSRRGWTGIRTPFVDRDEAGLDRFQATEEPDNLVLPADPIGRCACLVVDIERRILRRVGIKSIIDSQVAT
jgi:cardiolipin synthase A/B